MYTDSLSFPLTYGNDSKCLELINKAPFFSSSDHHLWTIKTSVHERELTMKDVSNSYRHNEHDLVRTWCRTLHSPQFLYRPTFGVTFRRQFAAASISLRLASHYFPSLHFLDVTFAARQERNWMRQRGQEEEGKDAGQIGSTVVLRGFAAMRPGELWTLRLSVCLSVCPLSVRVARHLWTGQTVAAALSCQATTH